MESNTIYITWVSDISRAGCLVFDDWPFCSGNATMFKWGTEELTTRAKCYNRVWDYRADVQYYWSQTVNQALNWAVPLVPRSLHDDATAPEKWLCVSAFFLRLVPVSSPLHFLMTPVMPRKRLLVFFPSFLFPFSQKGTFSHPWYWIQYPCVCFL